MTSSRLALTIGALLVAVLALTWGVRRHPHREQPAAPTTTPIAVQQDTASPTPTPSPARHRLAGVAAGPVGYVVVEAPDGSSALYRLGEEVPGLGRLTAIRGKRASFDTPAGSLELQIAPAPTRSPVPRRTMLMRTRTRRPLKTPRAVAAPTRTARESSP